MQFRYFHLSISNSMMAKLNQVFTKGEREPFTHSNNLSLSRIHTARHRPVQVTLPKLPRKQNLKYGSSSNLKQIFRWEMKHSWERLKAMAFATNNNARSHAHALQSSLWHQIKRRDYTVLHIYRNILEMPVFFFFSSFNFILAMFPSVIRTEQKFSFDFP